jgi:hypothetical protein
MPPDPPPRSVSVNQKSYIPVTSASAERSFSKPKSVKTVIRSVMNQERLGELLTLACERDLTDTIDLDEIANLWSNLTKRGHF